MVIDTACSSSLYGLHAACSAISNQDCDAAVVAGANLIQSVEQYLGMEKAGVLSSTSTCHTFSDQADGYARGDAVGALYLKRLSDAIRDNDRIRAVIRGCAVGSNGKTSGISAPDADAQERVIRHTYRKPILTRTQHHTSSVMVPVRPLAIQSKSKHCPVYSYERPRLPW